MGLRDGGGLVRPVMADPALPQPVGRVAPGIVLREDRVPLPGDPAQDTALTRPAAWPSDAVVPGRADRPCRRPHGRARRGRGSARAPAARSAKSLGSFGRPCSRRSRQGLPQGAEPPERRRRRSRGRGPRRAPSSPLGGRRLVEDVVERHPPLAGPRRRPARQGDGRRARPPRPGWRHGRQPQGPRRGAAAPRTGGARRGRPGAATPRLRAHGLGQRLQGGDPVLGRRDGSRRGCPCRGRTGD